MGVFSHHSLTALKNTLNLGRIRGYDFRLAIEVKFDWYLLDKPCLVSTMCIREFSNVCTSFLTVQYWICEMHRISAVFTSFRSYDFGLQTRAENGGIFPSHLDGSWNHIELGRIKGFDFRLAIEVKFDWRSFDKPCLFSTIMYSGVFQRLNLVPNGSKLDVWNASN
jgi:hypothetical protein